MTAQILNGTEIAAEIRHRLKAEIKKFPQTPTLAIILVGDDDSSLIYVRNKQKAATEIGIKTSLFHLDEQTSQADLLKIIDNCNQNPSINGIIVQLPLPKHINANKIIDHINPLKDVDGFHPYNTGLLQNNAEPYFIAATPLGIMELICRTNNNLSGKNVVLIGASLIVGRPLATLLLNQECTVTITHIHTKNIKTITQNADILIVACGVARMVKHDWIKKDAILIDVGINRHDGKICGDIDFDDVKNKAAALTPVPGGVGPMTIAMLLQNTVRAYKLQHKDLLFE